MTNIDYTNFTAEELHVEISRLNKELAEAHLRVSEIEHDICRAKIALYKYYDERGIFCREEVTVVDEQGKPCPVVEEVETTIIDDDGKPRSVSVRYY